MRSAKWDNLKFILIFLVVFGHFLQSLTLGDLGKSVLLFIYSFHMPAFVFVSGMFSKGVIREKKYYKVMGFLYLFIIIKLVRFLSYLLLQGEVSFPFVEIADVSWYAWAVFIFYVITMCIAKFDLKKVFIYSIIVSCLCGYSSEIGINFSLSRIVTFYPYFLAGFCMDGDKIQNFVQKKKVSILGMIFMVLMCICFLYIVDVNEYSVYISLFKGSESYETLNEYAMYGGLFRLCWYVFSFALIFAAITLTPSRKHFFTNIGCRTISVYALHYEAERFLLKIFDLKHRLKIVADSDLLLVAVISMALVCVLSVPPLDHLIKKIIMAKKDSN